MSTKKIICLILTFLLLLVCVASCQAANAGITTQEQAADRQSSDAPAETVSYGKDSSDRTEAEASHTKNVTEDVLPSEPDPASEGETMIYAHIGDKTLTIRPEDNSSAKAFVELLQGGDRTIIRERTMWKPTKPWNPMWNRERSGPWVFPTGTWRN